MTILGNRVAWLAYNWLFTLCWLSLTIIDYCLTFSACIIMWLIYWPCNDYGSTTSCVWPIIHVTGWRHLEFYLVCDYNIDNNYRFYTWDGWPRGQWSHNRKSNTSITIVHALSHTKFGFDWTSLALRSRFWTIDDWYWSKRSSYTISNYFQLFPTRCIFLISQYKRERITTLTCGWEWLSHSLNHEETQIRSFGREYTHDWWMSILLDSQMMGQL